MATKAQKITPPASRAVRIQQRFDKDWRFLKGETADASGAAFDDSSWRVLDLPHDWSIEDLPALPPACNAAIGEFAGSGKPSLRGGPFDVQAEGAGSQGFTVGGVGWYRKSFTPPRGWQGRRVWLTFDGVYMNCRVWCNGTLVAEHPYGYTSFHADLTAHVKPGEANTIAVRVDASGRNSRWYPGAGIYRHVTLTAAAPVHVKPWGVAVTTPDVARGRAVVRVRTTVRNETDTPQQVALESLVRDPSGRKAGAVTTRQPIAAGAEVVFDQSVTVAAPQLWSPESPALYQVASTVTAAGSAADAVTTTFGIRTIEVDAEKGLRLNGKGIKLRGACVHHDNGALGSCTYDRAEERRVERLKAAGFNAIRTAHNPPSPAFLDACDRLGVLVMDEAFDTWLWGKNPQDYGRFFAAWWPRDIASMVNRDRNHPSIIFWSIGNEIQGQDKPECLQYSEVMSDFVRKLDPSRPVTQAFMPIGNWDDLFPGFDALDVVGYNYKYNRYIADHQKRPRQVIVSTESFPSECFDYWMPVLDLPYVIGDFVWTGYDYVGEAALGRTAWDGKVSDMSATWPWTVAYCGDIDICGWRRAPSYYRETVFGVKPVVSCFVRHADPAGGIAPWGWMDEQACWTWDGLEGQTLKVNVYSSCPRVRLTLNGRDLGVKDTTRETRFRAQWDLAYEAGELVAVGLDAKGREQARWTLQTAAKPAALRLTADRPAIAADNLVAFSLEGPGTIVAVSNGNPCSLESFQKPQRKAFRGRCQVVVKAGEKKGAIRLRASAEGLAGAETVIKVR